MTTSLVLNLASLMTGYDCTTPSRTMAICLPTYWAAIWLKVVKPPPVNDRCTTQPCPLAKLALADFTSFPVMRAGPSASREAPWSSDPLRMGRTTCLSGVSWSGGVVGILPVRAGGGVAAGAVVGVVAGAVVADVADV